LEDIFEEIIVIGDTTMYQSLKTENKIKNYRKVIYEIK